MDIYLKVKCSKCKKETETINLFSGGLCVDCYETQFNKTYKNKPLPKPNFIEVVK